MSTICNKHNSNSKKGELNQNHQSVTSFKNKSLGNPPRDIVGVGRLLGILRYFCRHIQCFSSVAQPLYDLLIKLVSGNQLVTNKSLIAWGRNIQ